MLKNTEIKFKEKILNISEEDFLNILKEMSKTKVKTTIKNKGLVDLLSAIEDIKNNPPKESSGDKIVLDFKNQINR